MSGDAPNFVEQIVCLANSRKISGRCIAGKRTNDQAWIRPISSRPKHEISEYDRRYADGETAQLLDIIEIPCIEKMPTGHQSENVLIDDQFYWEKKGRASWDDVVPLLTTTLIYGRVVTAPTTIEIIAFPKLSSTRPRDLYV